jgi:hypothetical protein
MSIRIVRARIRTTGIRTVLISDCAVNASANAEQRIGAMMNARWTSQLKGHSHSE